MLKIDSKNQDFSFLLRKLHALLKYQFNLTTEQVKKIISDDCIIKISRKTKRIRSIEKNGKILFTLRPNDGFLIFHIEGALETLKICDFPKNRIVVKNEIAEMIAQGRTLFTKHVLKCDNRIKNSSEVIVVNENDELLAVGRSLLNYRELKDLNFGMGVKIRRGTKNNIN
ncbi:MAG: hypothetical protein EAX96_02595 [Candidatus Lokiarchaeota archaeon]|nr:hypothetical protein [Candidatus Lokiarchaeota archaeon]